VEPGIMPDAVTPPGLRLVGRDRRVDAEIVCPECRGAGRVPCPPTYSVRSYNGRGAYPQPSGGAPIPCPTCGGTKRLAVLGGVKTTSTHTRANRLRKG